MSETPKIVRTTYAAHPVWGGSTAAEVKFAPLTKRTAAKLFHDARRFERQTRKARHQDGALGRNGLAILHAMLFDCINYASGALYPSYATLAKLANISVRSVARGLAKLKAMGVVNWLRRCYWDSATGQLAQDTNAYGVLAANQWQGFKKPAPAPAPDAQLRYLRCWNAVQAQLELEGAGPMSLVKAREILAANRWREGVRTG